jgi:hypothetical protein
MNEIVLTSSQKALFWILKHFSNKLLKKYFPLDQNFLEISVTDQSSIYINERSNQCNVNFSINLKNYTNYEIFIQFIQIELVVNDNRFLNYEKVILKNFKNKEGTQFSVTIPLTYYQVNKIQQMVTQGNNFLQANFELNISTKNILGDMIFNKQLFKNIVVIISK